MIGKISIGKSFRGCISYCLEDKTPEWDGQPLLKNRAEILSYNLCFGNKKELIQQFVEVRVLNPKLSRPVLHITLSLHPEEMLAKAKLIEVVEECARHLGFEKNQYISVHHNDTKHQHIHIVANRVGFDGKTLRDNHNYKRIANYCRKMELKYDLKQVLSPQMFLPKEMRQITRHDQRKENLKQHIQQSLSKCHSYPDFEKQMQEKGYQIIKARGISFLDKQKVKVKGSEVGYSLQTIEKLLSLKPELRRQIFKEEEEIKHRQQLSTITPGPIRKSTESFQQKSPSHLQRVEKKELPSQSGESKILNILLRPERQSQNINPQLLKKKKRQKQKPHL